MTESNKHNPLVSILISCFNVARFIDSGIQDILEQSYQNIEIIIVDDGSTDKTPDILNRWAKRDRRISIITHQRNKGLGAARNTGIDAANGDYIYFFDVDDRLKSDTISYCVQEMEKRDTDMLIFGFEAVTADHPEIVDEVKYKETYAQTSQEIYDIYVDRIMLARHGNGFVWNKFYRRSFIQENQLRFGTQAIQQDAPFNLRAIAAASSLYISPYIGYRYFIYSSGNNGSRYIANRLDIINDVRECYESFLAAADICDKRCQETLNNKYWGGMLKFFIYDLNHPKCPHPYKIKKQIFQSSTNREYARLAARQVMHSNKHMDEKAMAYSVLHSNYALFCAIAKYGNMVRKLLKR